MFWIRPFHDRGRDVDRVILSIALFLKGNNQHKFAAFAIIRGGDYPRSDDAAIQQIKQGRG